VREVPVPQRRTLLRLIFVRPCQIEGEDRPDHTWPLDAVPRRKLREKCPMALLDPRDAGKRLLFLEQLQRAARDGSSQRIGGERMAMGQGTIEAIAKKLLENLIPRRRDRHRHVAGCEAL
jgi:hypothetical protein